MQCLSVVGVSRPADCAVFCRPSRITPNIATANERTPWQQRQHRLPLPAADCLSVRCVSLLGWSSLPAAACCWTSSHSDYGQSRAHESACIPQQPLFDACLPPVAVPNEHHDERAPRPDCCQVRTDLFAPLSVMFLAPTAPDAAALPMPLPNFMLFVFQFSGWKPACNTRA